MKKNFYKTMYRLLAGATRRVNWRWLNEWKVAMGISLIAAGHTATGKEAAIARVAARFEVQDETNLDVLAAPDSIAKKEDVFCYVAEEMPVFTAGSLQAYVRQHLLYPEEARKRKIAGTVYVEVHVGADGSVGNARIVRGVHPLLDKEVQITSSGFLLYKV